ncbi:molybdate ABC transporter substrate-binding protein [Lapillicoccus jejuensis]|uniref:Molybdate transport system substrate-binding protein n=1 Tax=Lapillicoccus jejuensis TaxID=402171 RepID=A0A542E4Y6_9MICO|nr:molybdate ABC transporter substrate-binding protein [Lapillicoccus jejuensis]TQJ10334.1 molybdate transport system substrate-binding protein [Lapillicoccus jejuensis]
MRHRLVLAVPAVAALLLAGCGGGSSPAAGGTSGAGTSSSALSGTVTVFAAASLKESFTALGTAFEQAHPGVQVTFNFGPSSGLATSITQGNPADVFASASPTNMDAVVKAGDASNPTTFAKNVMEIAVPPSNPGKVAAVADLGRSGVKVALCQAQVPCGKVARQVLTNAKVSVTPVSDETDVKAVLTKVQLGEVDAGVVYVTDVKAAGTKVTGVEIPSDVNASTSYPIATLNKAPNPTAAAAFTAYVLSSAGTQALTAAGFEAP